MSAGLAELLEDVEHVMIEFDGPVCSVFGGDSAPEAAERLRRLAASQTELPKALRLTDDPLDFLQLASDDSSALARQIGDAVRDAEVSAVHKATATPGLISVLTAARRTRRVLSIVGDNSLEAVETYLTDRRMGKHFEAVEGRIGADASQRMPSSYLLARALGGYATRHGVTPEQARRSSVFVSASIAGVRAAGAVGVACVGFGGRRGDRRRFEEESDAAAVITDLHELADALNARWDAAWCANQGCC